MNTGTDYMSQYIRGLKRVAAEKRAKAASDQACKDQKQAEEPAKE